MKKQKNANPKKKMVFGLLAVLLVGLWLWQCCNFDTVRDMQMHGLQKELFRLHVVANSDSQEDQQLKLAVRDALLPAVKEKFDEIDLMHYPGNCYAQRAANAAREMMGYLSRIAQQAVYQNGSTVVAAVSVGRESFPDKKYEQLSVPAGEYYCLQVRLGAAKGQNWWCVLYPPLCISPAMAEDYFTEQQMDILTGTSKYRFRFAFWDWVQKMRTVR